MQHVCLQASCSKGRVGFYLIERLVFQLGMIHVCMGLLHNSHAYFSSFPVCWPSLLHVKQVVWRRKS